MHHVYDTALALSFADQSCACPVLRESGQSRRATPTPLSQAFGAFMYVTNPYPCACPALKWPKRFAAIPLHLFELQSCSLTVAMLSQLLFRLLWMTSVRTKAFSPRPSLALFRRPSLSLFRAATHIHPLAWLPPSSCLPSVRPAVSSS